MSQPTRAGDALMMMLSMRSVLKHMNAQSATRLSNYAKTSSLPKVASDLYQAAFTRPAAPNIQKPVRAHDMDSETRADPIQEAVIVNDASAPIPESMSEPMSNSAATVNDTSVLDNKEQLYESLLASAPKPTTESPGLEEPVSQLLASLCCWSVKRAPLKQSRVPSSRIERVFSYSGIAAGVGVGMVTEAMRRAIGTPSSSVGSLVLSPANVERIVAGLSRMRGAALKLGQMLSIQDNKMMPAEVETLMLRVQKSANYMPDSQFQSVMIRELGSDWRDKFATFDEVPIAAASIGQVHRATLPSGEAVAVKVQYPGVATSINSDLSTLRSLVLLGGLLPKGLYLDNTIRVARVELGWECDYLREAENSSRMRTLLKGDSGFVVPKVVEELSTSQVLTSEFVEGVPIGETGKLSQAIRDSIGDRILRLCLRELFEFRFMQTDPNWSNFLYDAKKDLVCLIDFGAAREFSKDFTDKYMQVLTAAAENDRDGVIHWSRELGFLTGLESLAMTNAHVSSVMALATPFLSDSPCPFNFAGTDLTSQVRSFIPTMLKERLTPPPDETYSLHRKLSGAWLLCTKLGASVRVRDIWNETRDSYRF
ncbi:hypothetical protein SmJEL517_g05609 [Synchytrium microbalum]|uniref:ABC1 atypical kinase-like domain-containing protein n=1 Tax=Synchytrium microbalum TaxID=1806994 RepID=A0A507C028_9FUNG|nr:uncharacterized protein SmJEL517_g05609 [Synchytrium microbalum]TPX30955.1 hypothetical protein SmJEL517_g05609 [Synchytrium microbalum]